MHHQITIIVNFTGGGSGGGAGGCRVGGGSGAGPALGTSSRFRFRSRSALVCVEQSAVHRGRKLIRAISSQ
ncbi:hypothetical protein CYMTET_4671 [Cymbomonas tetramitiformis]|uniref:Uncharacterized protein n=1 Tax=Cymbomonas tetramitiformis TaxID=36881 RepID=A0AAE0H109_9CHLO|nr:hypothetical protein CYMTET_4671 [Cymbomonas tetramitiformis]